MLTIFKDSLNLFFLVELEKNESFRGKVGESVLSAIINPDGEMSCQEVHHIVDILRKLCRRQAVNNILSSHGITFVRSTKLYVTYRFGDSFSLAEFSPYDLVPRVNRKRDYHKVINIGPMTKSSMCHPMIAE